MRAALLILARRWHRSRICAASFRHTFQVNSSKNRTRTRKGFRSDIWNIDFQSVGPAESHSAETGGQRVSNPPGAQATGLCSEPGGPGLLHNRVSSVAVGAYTVFV